MFLRLLAISLIFLCQPALCQLAFAGSHQYLEYEARVIKIIDGDSIKANAFVFPHLTWKAIVRVRGIDAPELRARCAKEKHLAQAAKNYVYQLLKPDQLIKLRRIKGGKYAGRVVASVLFKDDSGRWVDLSDVMLKSDFARPYQGGKRKSWCH